MKMLYVIDSLAPGGAETSLAELAEPLVSNGIELHVLPLGPDRSLKSRLVGAGAVVHDVSEAGARIHNIRVVQQLIRRVQPRLVHTTLYESNIAGRIAARLAGLPSSTSIVGDTYGVARAATVNRHKLRAALAVDRATARMAYRFHVVSQALAKSTEQGLKIPRNRIAVIPRGRDPRRFPYRAPGVRSKVRLQLGIPESTPIVLSVGRLERTKGLEFLIDALPRVSERFPELVVLMAGKDGASSGQLRAKAQELKAHVRFLGHRHDIPELMAAADVLCFPSLSEGSPGTLIEAMAVGCAIVASAIPANYEVLGTGLDQIGLTVAAQDPAALADALITTLTAPRDASLRIESGRERFEAFYQASAVAQRMAAFFSEVASQR